MVAAGCFSRVRTRASEALAWALILLLAPLVTGGLGAGRRVTCRTLSSTLAGGITSPSTQKRPESDYGALQKTSKQFRGLEQRSPSVSENIPSLETPATGLGSSLGLTQVGKLRPGG